MSMGSMTLACLLMTVNAAPPDICHLSLRRFTIPITIDPKQRADIRELVLYVSHDEGRSWNLEGKSGPEQDSFPFEATQEGSYWFRIAVIYKNGRQSPADIYQAVGEQRVLVDTLKPDVKLVRAERKGDQVEIAWVVNEDHPDTAKFRLEYRPLDGANLEWLGVEVKPAPEGNVRFKPAFDGPIAVRLVLQDLAKNVGSAEVRLAGSAGGLPPDAQVASTEATKLPGREIGNYRPTGASLGGDRLDVLPPPSDGFNANGGSSLLPPSDVVPKPLSTQVGANSSGMTQQVVARTPMNTAQDSLGQGLPQALPPTARGVLPPVRVVKQKQVRLDFQVGKYGPSGLGSVEVYSTVDDGATWAKAQTDRAAALPFAPAGGGTGPLLGSVTVDLKDEGVAYGFYLVVKSRAGLGKEAPRPGTAPQIRVEMDSTLPVADLYEPRADPTRRDTLLLGWKAEDKNLATNPITLEWSARKEGPWNYIGAAELPNTGRYSWQVPADVPPAGVYLKLTVRDTAGNVAEAKTNEPVLVDLSVPEVDGITVGDKPGR